MKSFPYVFARGGEKNLRSLDLRKGKSPKGTGKSFGIFPASPSRFSLPSHPPEGLSEGKVK
jgi:hypothetical protein